MNAWRAVSLSKDASVEGVEALRLWQKMTTQLLVNMEEVCVRRRRSSWTWEDEKVHQMCSFMWADNFWMLSHSQRNLEQMLRDLIEEAGRWDLTPKPARLWWTSTCDSEEKCDLSINTTTGCHRFSFEEKFKILGCALNRQEKVH